VDDEPGRVLEDERRQRELLGPRLPERRDPLVEDAVREQTSDDAVVPLRRPTVIPATRWCRTKSWRTTTPGRRRRASTIPACASGLLPTW